MPPQSAIDTMYANDIVVHSPEVEDSNPHHPPVSTQKARYEVSFSNRVRVKRIPHINYLRHKVDINKIWFSEEELYSTRRECRQIVNYMDAYDRKSLDSSGKQSEMNSNLDTDENFFCTRGLEKFTKVGRDVCRTKRRNAIKSVMKEQDLQRSLGVQDPDILACAYNLSSYPCQVAARMTAVQDYKAASYQRQ